MIRNETEYQNTLEATQQVKLNPMANRLNRNEIVTPTAEEIGVAKVSSRVLAQNVDGEEFRIQIGDGPDRKECVLPQSAARVLLGILTEMSLGNSIVCSAIQPEISTHQAAELLNVSHPYFLKLLDEGAITHRVVNTFRRVRLDELLAYKKESDAKRYEALQELTALSQEMGLYDDPMK
jgi:excisionase family DNA binding protein